MIFITNETEKYKIENENHFVPVFKFTVQEAIDFTKIKIENLNNHFLYTEGNIDFKSNIKGQIIANMEALKILENLTYET